MSKKQKSPREAPPAAKPDGGPPTAGRRAPLWLAGLVMSLLLAAGLYFGSVPPQADTPAPPAAAPATSAMPMPVAAATPPPAAAAYVGGAACSSCHAQEHAAWQGSHHDLAMAVADAQHVLGRFERTVFRHQGVTSTFFKRDGRFFVNTDGPDGKLADFEITYTFGHAPLQQYLVDFPGGRLQALGIAWDSRPAAQGGQRWFHLYPDRKLKAGEPLHWTGIDQVWNYQCADCHSTNLRKQYDEKTNRYNTTWTDINVTCEACHGPGSNHLAWAQRQAGGNNQTQHPADATKGLSHLLDERRGALWSIDPVSGNALRSKPRDSSREIETCARCHARRGQFSDQWQAGDRLADGFRSALIEPGLYHDDGQMREEVFNHGSFLASKMHSKGVTCADCHDPHSQKLRAPGNAVCGQCHAPGKYDAAAHHHHDAGSKGAQCAACHMPTTTYMVVDPRHDHSFRIPRPDRSVSGGPPNACNQCHTDRPPQWAADAVKAWTPKPQPGFQTFAEAFATTGPGAPAALAGVLADPTQPAFVRASAIRRMGLTPGAATLPLLRDALRDADALVRAAAAAALASADPAQRAQWLPPLLADPVRQVRMEAARALAGAPAARLTPQGQAQLAVALDEVIAAERFNNDRPEGRANLGNLYATQGRLEAAVAAYQSALALDPSFHPAALNLAEVHRSRGAESEAENTLRAALARDPRLAEAHLALGLSLARQRRSDEALKSFAQAARLAPDNPRNAYVFAVALNDAGQRRQAVLELQRGLARQPDDHDLLLTAALFERDAGNRPAALVHARRLLTLEPDNPDAQQLARGLGSPNR